MVDIRMLLRCCIGLRYVSRSLNSGRWCVELTAGCTCGYNLPKAIGGPGKNLSTHLIIESPQCVIAKRLQQGTYFYPGSVNSPGSDARDSRYQTNCRLQFSAHTHLQELSYFEGSR